MINLVLIFLSYKALQDCNLQRRGMALPFVRLKVDHHKPCGWQMFNLRQVRNQVAFVGAMHKSVG